MNTKITALIVAGLLLSACGPTSTALPNKKPEAPKKDVFTSIKDAVTKQMTLKCTYSDNGQETTTYIKGKQVRFSGSGKEIGVEGLMKDDKFYLWNTKDKTGMTLDISKMGGAKMGDTSIKSVDDVVSQIEAKKQNCNLSPESDSMFELPTDIKFASAPDFSSLAK